MHSHTYTSPLQEIPTKQSSTLTSKFDKRGVNSARYRYITADNNLMIPSSEELHNLSQSLHIYCSPIEFRVNCWIRKSSPFFFKRGQTKKECKKISEEKQHLSSGSWAKIAAPPQRIHKLIGIRVQIWSSKFWPTPLCALTNWLFKLSTT